MHPDQEEQLHLCVNPLETDTIHDVIVEESVQGKTLDVTITSTYDNDLQKAVPMQVTIMFGRSAKHYEKHFQFLFSLYDMESFDDFDASFPGNTCDLSDAERVGFFDALAAFLKAEYGVIVESDDLLHNYAFFLVHFKWSVSRVANNSGVIPVERRSAFKRDVHELLQVLGGQIDHFIKECHYMFAEYPKAKNWLLWYLQKDHAAICFKACKSLSAHQMEKFETLWKDTNSQENVG